MVGDFQNRVSQRTAMPRKGSRKKFDYIRQGSEVSPGGVVKSLSTESGGSGALTPSTIDEELVMIRGTQVPLSGWSFL